MMMVSKYTEKKPCEFCGKNISIKNILKHQMTKKCQKKQHPDDKTAGTNHIVHKSPSLPEEAGFQSNVFPASPAESQSSHLKEINLNQEFDKMATKLNPKIKNESDKDMKECGACGEQFSKLKEGKCPYCDVELEA